MSAYCFWLNTKFSHGLRFFDCWHLSSFFKLFSVLRLNKSQINTITSGWCLLKILLFLQKCLNDIYKLYYYDSKTLDDGISAKFLVKEDKFRFCFFVRWASIKKEIQKSDFYKTFSNACDLWLFPSTAIAVNSIWTISTCTSCSSCASCPSCASCASSPWT